MNLICENCDNTNNVMNSFGRFNKISSYLQALVNAYKNGDFQLFTFIPQNCAYLDPRTNVLKWIVEVGYVSKNAQKYITELEQKVNENQFMNNKLQIKVDAAESDCFFSWLR